MGRGGGKLECVLFFPLLLFYLPHKVLGTYSPVIFGCPLLFSKGQQFTLSGKVGVEA